MSDQLATTLSFDIVRAALFEAEARGFQRAALCERFGIASSAISDPDARIDSSLAIRIWTELPELTGLADFGLAAAQRRLTQGGPLTVITFLQRSAKTVGDGIFAVLRYYRAVQETFRYRITSNGEEMRCELSETEPGLLVSRHAVQFTIARVQNITRQATGLPLALRAIEFRHEKPADDSAAREAFGCELRYDAPALTLVAQLDVVKVPQLTSDPDLAEFLERQARDLERRLGPTASFVASVQRVIADELATGSMSLELISQRLKLSVRTVQRRLRDEGTTWQQVLEQVRRELAARYLAEPRVAIQEIALLLGFADQSSFYHAFLRWYGETPRAYRQRKPVR